MGVPPYCPCSGDPQAHPNPPRRQPPPNTPRPEGPRVPTPAPPPPYLRPPLRAAQCARRGSLVTEHNTPPRPEEAGAGVAGRGR